MTSGVPNSFRQRPDLIERRRKRDKTESRNPAISRFEPDNAGKRRWLSNGAASIATQRTKGCVRGDRGRRTAAGSTRNPREVPRITRQFHRGILGGRTHCKLVKIGFAQWDCARGSQFLNNSGIIGLRDNLAKSLTRRYTAAPSR